LGLRYSRVSSNQRRDGWEYSGLAALEAKAVVDAMPAQTQATHASRGGSIGRSVGCSSPARSSRQLTPQRQRFTKLRCEPGFVPGKASTTDSQ